jgi:16S rRNA (adenine1518-N6/adenine1519-N6)-dimethyltransferase
MTNPYTTPARVRAALRALHIQPTRGMGQHFLVDPEALQTIVAAAELAPHEQVIEIGPGLGVLTWELLQQTNHVLAVELDKRLAARLPAELASTAGAQRVAGLHIVQGDVLRLPPAQLLQQAGVVGADNALPAYKVVANLPYAITSPVLRHFLEYAPRPRCIVVLVQWEVARRITAAPGDLSILAHAIQMYAQPELVARVSASSFFPVPAVDSAILRLQIRPTSAVAVADEQDFFRILKAGFLLPRKKLSNSLPKGLAALGEPVSREVAVAALHAAGVSPDRRAETVSLDEWAAIYHTLRGAL